MKGKNIVCSVLFALAVPAVSVGTASVIEYAKTGFTGVRANENIPPKQEEQVLDQQLQATTTSTSIIVELIEGAEYSLDNKTWQDSNVFADLSPATNYVIYARLKATESSPASNVISAEYTTLKTTQSAPQINASDVVVTSDTITMPEIEGVEYSLNNATWQDSNVFAGLSSATTYTIYARYAETSTAYASNSISCTYTTTAEQTAEEPTAKKLNFSVSGNKLTGYLGTEMPEELTLPSSYSLGDEKVVSYSLEDEEMLSDYIFLLQEKYMGSDFEANIFNYEFADAQGNKTICQSLFQIDEFRMNIQQIYEEFILNPYPVTVSYVEQEIIEGTDFQITEISSFDCPNLPSISYKLNVELDKLHILNIPASITNIEVLFNNFDNITSFNVDNDNRTYKSIDGAIIEKDTGILISFPNGKTGDYILPNDVKSFRTSWQIFQNSQLNSIKLNENIVDLSRAFTFSKIKKIDCSNTQITNLGSYALSGAEFNELILPDTLQIISANAMEGCRYFRSLLIPNSVTRIEAGAFLNCNNLEEIVIPENVSIIGKNAFRNCYNLQNVDLGNVITIEEYAFNNCKNVTSLIMSDSLVSIGKYAFQNCNKLTSLQLSNSLQSIGQNAFEYCQQLVELVIPNSVIEIGANAFYFCDNLTSLTLGSNLQNLGINVFWQSGQLTVTILAETPPAWASLNANGVFNASKVDTIYIPSGTLEAYQNANGWSNYADKFVELEAETATE